MNPTRSKPNMVPATDEAGGNIRCMEPTHSGPVQTAHIRYVGQATEDTHVIPQWNVLLNGVAADNVRIDGLKE